MDDAAAKQVLAGVDEKAIVALARELVEISSFKAEETPLANFLHRLFQQRGYEVELQEVEPGRFQTVARLKGSGGGKSLMFNGHLDIDPLPMGLKRNPFKPSIEGNRLYGAGAFNMKGGLAAMITAAEALRQAEVERKGDLIIACVVGELQGGVGSAYLMEKGLRTDMAIIPEPYGADNLMTTHAGWVELAIHTLGFSQHISTVEKAVDAIEKMMKVIAALKKMEFTHTPHPDLPGLPRLIVGVIIGGRGRQHDLKGPNFTSDFCTALVDVRNVPGQTSKMVLTDIRQVLEELKREDPQLEYEIESPPPPQYEAQRVTMEPVDIPKDEYIVQAVARNYQELTGQAPKTIGAILPLAYAANDSAHLLKAGIPCVLYGPSGGWDQPGEPDQWVNIDEMVLCSKVMALTALEVCNLQ